MQNHLGGKAEAGCEHVGPLVLGRGIHNSERKDSHGDKTECDAPLQEITGHGDKGRRQSGRSPGAEVKSDRQIHEDRDKEQDQCDSYFVNGLSLVMR